MKKLLLLATLLMVLSQSQSQSTFNKAYHYDDELANPFLLNIQGDLYFTTTWGNFGSSALYKHSSGGALSFRVPVLNGAVCSYMHKTLDNQLALSGWMRICDVPQPNQTNTLAKVDTYGSVIFTATYQTVSGDDPVACVQAADSTYLSFTDSLLFRHSKTGQFLGKTNLGLSGIKSALLLPSGNVLLSALQGSYPVLMTISSSGSLIVSVFTPAVLTQMQFYGGQKIMGRGTDGNIYKFRPNHTLIGSGPSASSLPIINFVCSNDTIYSILSSGSGGASYEVSDTSFNQLSYSSTNTNKIRQCAIVLSGSKVAILSEGVAGNAATNFPNHFVTLNVIDKTNSNNFVPDLALQSVEVDSSYSSCTSMSTATFCQTYMRPKIQVKNTGQSTITNFMLSCMIGPAICGASYHHWLFSSLSIPPNGTATLTANSFVMKTAGVFSNTPNTADLYYCFFTSIPNNQADKTLEDNENCQTYTITVGLIERALEGPTVAFVPNPFSEHFTVESGSLLKVVKVYNSLGALVKTIRCSGRRMAVDCEELPAGVYIVRIETETGAAIKKVVKE